MTKNGAHPWARPEEDEGGNGFRPPKGGRKREIWRPKPEGLKKKELNLGLIRKEETRARFAKMRERGNGAGENFRIEKGGEGKPFSTPKRRKGRGANTQ